MPMTSKAVADLIDASLVGKPLSQSTWELMLQIQNPGATFCWPEQVYGFGKSVNVGELHKIRPQVIGFEASLRNIRRIAEVARRRLSSVDHEITFEEAIDFNRNLDMPEYIKELLRNGHIKP
jgi:hypothetical protein